MAFDHARERIGHMDASRESRTMADTEAPAAEALKEPEGPSPYEQKSPFYAKRIELFEKYFAREGEKLEAAKAKNETIKVVMPDGAIKEGIKFVTSPWDIAMGIHKKLAQSSLLAHVDGADWDMRRPSRATARSSSSPSTIRRARSSTGTPARTFSARLSSSSTAPI